MTYGLSSSTLEIGCIAVPSQYLFQCLLSGWLQPSSPISKNMDSSELLSNLSSSDRIANIYAGQAMLPVILKIFNARTF
jgi:hypothetical protein